MTKTIHEVIEGDILCASWGATMTMVDFFKVTKVTPHTVTFVPLHAVNVSDGGFMSGTSTPSNEVENNRNAPFTRRKKAGREWIRGEYSTQIARPWDGKPKYYNHCD